MTDPLLEIRDLRVEFSTFDGTVNALNGVSLTVGQGEALGLVGESGSGKSVLALAAMGLLNRRGARVDGSVRIGGIDVLGAPAEVVRRLRGEKVAIVFQDPLSALHPHFTVGHQIAEAYRAHTDASKASARQRAVELLERVGIPDSAAPRALVPARAVRRHAPAGHDRDGARLRSRAADRRRAHHGARRHGAGADPRPDRRAAGARWTWPSSSSPTTSASPRRSPTGSR